jgi:hypothetical protein
MNVATYCPNCGSPQAAGAVFCVSCGATQPVAATIDAIGPAPSPAPATPDTTQPPIGAAASESTVRLPILHLVGAVVGVSVGVAALAVALTIALSGAGPAPGNEDPPPTSGDLKVVEVDNIRAEVPITWDVVTRARDTIVVEDPGSRALWLRSASLPAAITMEAIQERFLDKARGQSPDAKICAGPETAALPGGPAGGRYFVVCSTFIPQGGGPAVRLADAYYIGLDATSVTVAVMQLTAVPEALEAFATEIRRLPPPVWKLYP